MTSFPLLSPDTAIESSQTLSTKHDPLVRKHEGTLMTSVLSEM